jgi:DNA-binding MarR family transcriptional regulator
MTAERELSHELVRYGRFIHMLRTSFADLLPPGLDPAAAQLLAWLVKQGPSRLGELAECTFLDPSTVSRRVSQLVRQGLVERQADPADGRAVQLVPTRQGEDLFATMLARREEVMHRVLVGWAGADLTALGQLMRKFNDDCESYLLRLNSPSQPHFPPVEIS